MLTYINGIDCISAQQEKGNLVPLTKGQTHVNASEPDYKEKIDPRKIRRLDKMTKMGLYSSMVSLGDAGLENVDGIVVGVGQTFSDNPSVMLEKLVNHDEGLVNPGMFLNSLLSSASGQIALDLKCYGYNNTLTQRGFSFESALMDGILQLENEGCENMLVGGIDVVTDTYLKLAHEYGFVNSSGFDSGAYFANHDQERIVGEGSGFFTLSKSRSENTYAAIKGLACTFLKEPGLEIVKKLSNFFREQKVINTQIDLVVSGKGFDHLFEGPYLKTEEKLLKGIPHLYFKKYCGEYPTSTTFGLWLSAQILKNQELPEGDPVAKKIKGPVKNILLINSFAGNYYTFILLQKP